MRATKIAIMLLATAVTVHAPLYAMSDPEVAAGSQYQSKMLTVAEAKADVAIVRQALETVHPGLYRYQDKKTIDRAFARLENATNTPIEQLALHREIAVMLAAIHCDHSKAEMPDAIDSFRTQYPTHLPLRFEMIEGRMIVISTDGQNGAPDIGSELLRINGMTVPKLLLTLSGTVAYDGDTDQAIAKKLGDDSDLMGDNFNENYPSFFGFPKQWTLVWKPVGSRDAKTSVLQPVNFKQWVKLTPPGGAYRNEFYNGITWRLAGKTARLKIDTFVNYRNPVQPTAFLSGFFRAMKSAGTEHLILDLRENGGGSEDVSVALARYLFDKPFIWSKPVRYKAIRYGDLPQYIDSWGDRDELFNPSEANFAKTKDGWFDRIPDASANELDDDISTIEHKPALGDRFAGKLTVLSSPANASGATRTIAQLKERRGAVIVGEDTSGSAEGPTAGQIFLVKLPNSGIKVRVPNAWNRTNIEGFTPRLGVRADRLVVPTLADYENGRDAALEIARAMPQKSSNIGATLAKAFTGSWTGTLDYRDYGNDGRVVLPTKLEADGLKLAWSFDDGPGKMVQTDEVWAFGADEARLQITEGKSKSGFQIVQFDPDSKGNFTLVADGRAEENGSQVMARMIATLFGNKLRITKMTRSAGQPFIMRHAYELSRDGRQ